MTYLRNNGECKAFSLPGSLALYYYIDDGSVRVEDLKQNVQRRYSTNNKTLESFPKIGRSVSHRNNKINLISTY